MQCEQSNNLYIQAPVDDNPDVSLATQIKFEDRQTTLSVDLVTDQATSIVTTKCEPESEDLTRNSHLVVIEPVQMYPVAMETSQIKLEKTDIDAVTVIPETTLDVKDTKPPALHVVSEITCQVPGFDVKSELDFDIKQKSCENLVESNEASPVKYPVGTGCMATEHKYNVMKHDMSTKQEDTDVVERDDVTWVWKNSTVTESVSCSAVDTAVVTSCSTLDKDVVTSYGTVDTDVVTSCSTLDTDVTSYGTVDTDVVTSCSTVDTAAVTSYEMGDDVHELSKSQHLIYTSQHLHHTPKAEYVTITNDEVDMSGQGNVDEQSYSVVSDNNGSERYEPKCNQVLLQEIQGEKLLHCSHCHKTSTAECQVPLRKDKSYFSCPFCFKRSSESENTFPCSHCDRRFHRKSHLADHVRTHSDQNRLACPQCGKRFAKKNALTKHIRTHTGEKPFSCTYCESRFNDKATLIMHGRTHTGEKPFLCPYCDKRFINKCGLTKHVRIHTGEKPFPCPTCDKRFSDTSSLTKHVRTHTGEKPFPCPFCDKRFNEKTAARIHTRLHTGERPFACSHCDKRFTENGCLKNHIRTHTGEKPFPCSYCEKRFNQKGSLTKHIRIHTGEKPFSCCYCEKRFIEKCNLKTHLKTHKGFSCSVTENSKSDSI